MLRKKIIILKIDKWFERRVRVEIKKRKIEGKCFWKDNRKEEKEWIVEKLRKEIRKKVIKGGRRKMLDKKKSVVKKDIKEIRIKVIKKRYIIEEKDIGIDKKENDKCKDNVKIEG